MQRKKPGMASSIGTSSGTSITIVAPKATEDNPISHKTNQETPTKYRVALHTIEVIKGSVEREVEVFYSDEWSFEATLRPDVTYLLFLKKRGPEFHVVQGYGGRIVIEDHVAKGIHMDREAGTQNAETFIKRVKALRH